MIPLDISALTFPHIDPVLVQIGPFAIRWYALAYIAGLVIGWRYIVALVRRRELWDANGPPTPHDPATDADDIDGLLTWVTLGVILGGRLGYVLFYKPVFYLYNPGAILQVWEGGMSFHGGMLGVIIAIYLFARQRGLPLLSLSDCIGAAVPIGLFLGRLANFINGELYGRATDVAWAMKFPHWNGSEWAFTGDEVTRHPSQLYEAFLEGVVLFVLIRFMTHHTSALSRPGTVAGVFLTGYGLSRILVEFFRQPDAHLGYLIPIGHVGITQGMILSLPMIALGLSLVVRARRQAA